MTEYITAIGLVATDPRHIVTSEGLAITSFRLASNLRVFDRKLQEWVDKDTNWFTITAFRQLALNTAESVVRGDRVFVTGRLRIRDWESGDKSGTNVEIDAEAIGHNLNWGVTEVTRVTYKRNDENEEDAEILDDPENHTETDQEKVPAMSGWGTDS